MNETMDTTYTHSYIVRPNGSAATESFTHPGLGVSVVVNEFTQAQFEKFIDHYAAPKPVTSARQVGAVLKAALASGWITVEPGIADVDAAKPALVRWIVEGTPDLLKRYIEAVTIPPA